MTCYSRGVGQYRTDEIHLAVYPHGWKLNQTVRGCLSFHGAASTADGFRSSVSVESKINAIAEMGAPLLACDFGAAAYNGSTFGNDDSITAAALGWTYLKVPWGAKTDKFVVWAGSMGALTALNYLISLATPSDVCAAVAMSIPALDLDSFYQGDIGGFRSDIETAYAISHPTAIPNLATHSPVAYSNANKAKLTMPIKIFASDDDDVASNTAACQTWATSVNAQGGNVTVVGSAGPAHSGVNIPTNDPALFLAPYL